MVGLQPLPEPSTGGYAKSVNGQPVSSSSSSSSSSMLSATSSSHITSFMNVPSSPIHATHSMNSVRSPGFSTDSGFPSLPSSPHSPAETRGRSNTETGEVRANGGHTLLWNPEHHRLGIASWREDAAKGASKWAPFCLVSLLRIQRPAHCAP